MGSASYGSNQNLNLKVPFLVSNCFGLDWLKVTLRGEFLIDNKFTIFGEQLFGLDWLKWPFEINFYPILNSKPDFFSSQQAAQEWGLLDMALIEI